MTSLRILKVGSNILNNDAAFTQLKQKFVSWSVPKILVHGGGQAASELLKKLNITPEMYNGRRITDDATLEVVTMVYAGLLNKKIVAQLQALGCNALGLSGADLNSIRAQKRIIDAVDFGWAGDITTINESMLSTILALQITPVFCAITHDGNGQLLNTNADTIAASLASVLAKKYEVQLHYCFDRKGVLLDAKDDDSLISLLNKEQYLNYKAEGIIAGGMLPKLSTAFDALSQGVAEVHLSGVENLGEGTRLIV